MEEGEEDDHEGPGPITSRRPWQPGILMSKISRTVRGGEEVARNVRKGCQKRGGQRRFGNGPHMEEGEEDDHEGPGPITSRRPWQPGTLMSKIPRTVRGGEEVARNVRKGCRTLDDDEFDITVVN
jgi:hypothetical protein